MSGIQPGPSTIPAASIAFARQVQEARSALAATDRLLEQVFAHAVTGGYEVDLTEAVVRLHDALRLLGSPAEGPHGGR